MTIDPKLTHAFGKVADALGALSNDGERKRVLAAIICLFDDDHEISQFVVAAWTKGTKG